MFPTLLDLEVQTQINDEHILKITQRRQMAAHKPAARIGFTKMIVRFGAWLEQMGRKLQTRYSPASALAMTATGLKEGHLQQC
jgi:CRP-like cAMP-binding protein